MQKNILCLDNLAEININNPPFENHEPPSACLLSALAPIYFVVFVLISQFVLLNVVVAVLLKQLDVNENLFFVLFFFH